MFKQSRLVIALYLLTLFHLGAEGLPVDQKGNVTIPHSLITPNTSQLEEIETMGSLTLTSEQWRELRKVSPNTPKRLTGILPADWNDCTCGETWEGIRLKDGRIAVIHEEQTPATIGWSIPTRGPFLIYMDRRGQCYLKGRLVRFPLLLEAIAAAPSPSREPEADFHDRFAEVKIPLDGERTDPALTDRLKQLYTALAEKNWNDGEIPEWVTELRMDE